MKLYFAPMEGITTYTYRNTHNEIFGNCDCYFAPFIVPTDNERVSCKTLRDIMPTNNTAKIMPQVLCNSDVAFFEFAGKLKYLDFDEVNINLGCPATRVVQKGRGAGALKNRETLDRFLESVFAKSNIKISLKTRAGFYSHDEFDELIKIYSKYSPTELIVHPRVREELYKGVPNMETFEKAYNSVPFKLCYNGNICSVKDYGSLTGKYPELNSVMIGRGAVSNPAIFREIRGGKPLSTEELVKFTKLLSERYFNLFGSEEHTLHKLKEIWVYIMLNFPEEKKIFKALKKATKIAAFNSAVSCLPKLIRSDINTFAKGI